MSRVEQLELPLWQVLQEAAITPDAADVQQLLEVLDASLSGLDTAGQLQVAARAIAQIVQVFEQRSVLAFEQLEASNGDVDPIMPEDAFNGYVRQTMAVDLEQFIEPLASLPRRASQRSDKWDKPQGSVVGELDQAALLQILDEQMQQHPQWSEADIFNQALSIAHEEDVLAWGITIKQWLAEQQGSEIALVHLQQSLGMPLVQLWLALLLGEYAIEQRGQFYDNQQLWVLRRC